MINLNPTEPEKYSLQPARCRTLILNQTNDTKKNDTDFLTILLFNSTAIVCHIIELVARFLTMGIMSGFLTSSIKFSSSHKPPTKNS
jgi:hypothetical protein